MVEGPPAVSLETILGEGLPTEVLRKFHSEPDEMGFIDWHEVDRCPIRYVDPSSPCFEMGFFDEVFDGVAILNAEAPSHWLPTNPSAAFRSALIVVKSEGASASAHRMKNEEDW